MALTGTVVYVHTVHVMPWQPLRPQSFMATFMESAALMRRQNACFAVLIAELGQARGFSRLMTPSFPRWVCSVLRYGVRRLVTIAALVAPWTWAYVYAVGRDLPMNGVLYSSGLYGWWIGRRVVCMQPEHMAASLLLSHEVIFARQSHCHTVDVFEGLLQTDVICFAFMTLAASVLPQGGAGGLGSLSRSAVGFVAFVALAWLSPGLGHRVKDLLPVALGTWLVGAALPSAEHMAEWSPFSRFAAAAAAWTLIVAACVQNWLSETALEVGRLLQEAGEPWRQVADGLGTSVLVVGLVVVLRLYAAEKPAPPVAWSGRAACARLCGCINVSNLFVLHAVPLFFHEEDIELSLFSLFGALAATTAICAAIALASFLFLEGPIEGLMLR